MRTELQLVEFERGSYDPVPVAANHNGTVLINQLKDNQFAKSVLPWNPAVRQLQDLNRQFAVEHRVGQNCTHRGTIWREIIVEEDQTVSLPVNFDPPVEFEIPIR